MKYFQGPLCEILLSVERDVVLGTGYKDALILLEDLMAQSYDIEITLRLLCLVSLANQVRLKMLKFKIFVKLSKHSRGFFLVTLVGSSLNFCKRMVSTI